MEQISIEISEEQAGKRLDKALSDNLPDMSRARLQMLMAEGHVSTVSYTHLTLPTKA